MMQVNNRRVIEVYQVHRPERKQVHHPAASLPQPGVNHDRLEYSKTRSPKDCSAVRSYHASRLAFARSCSCFKAGFCTYHRCIVFSQDSRTMKTEMQDDSTQPPNCFEESCTPTVREVDTVNATAAASTAPTLPFDHPLASPPRTPRSRSPRPTAGKAGTRATPMDLLPDTQLWPDGGTIVIDLDEPMLHPPEKKPRHAHKPPLGTASDPLPDFRRLESCSCA